VNQDNQKLAEEYIRLALAIEEHMPGYVDAYFGPEEWKIQAQHEGKLPLQNLTKRTARLANDISKADNMDAQRKDFLARQVTAMQMSIRLLSGDRVSLAEEVNALYDVRPTWKDESKFEEAHKELDQLLPPGDSLSERKQAWDRSLEIPVERVKELLPPIIKRLREISHRKFNLPDGENFGLEYVSDKPWGAYNWYLGGYQSRIDINTDLPIHVYGLAGLIAHEGYPGHHTELAIKEQKLVRQKNCFEHTIALINSPSCVISEGIATSALETVINDVELEDWYREEFLPHTGMSHIDPKRIMGIEIALKKTKGILGNVSFMVYDHNKNDDEAVEYIRRYRLTTDKFARQLVKFITNPLYRSYTFTYHMGYDLFAQLFASEDRDTYFKRILEEPVTPRQIRQWIAESKHV